MFVAAFCIPEAAGPTGRSSHALTQSNLSSCLCPPWWTVHRRSRRATQRICWILSELCELCG